MTCEAFYRTLMRTVYIYRHFCWCFFFQNVLLFIAIKCFYFIPVMRTAHFYTCLCSYCVLSFYFYCTLFIYSFFFLFEGLAWGSCTRVTFLTGLKQYIQSALTSFYFLKEILTEMFKPNLKWVILVHISFTWGPR